MDWMKRIFGDSPPANLEFLTRPDSFSLVAIRGQVADAIPAWLGKRGYKQLETREVRAPFAKLYPGLRQVAGPRRNIVMKAVYVVSGFTVLLDPEMVLSSNRKALTELCATSQTTCFGAIWERNSQTVLLTQVDATGQRRFVVWTAGKQPAQPIEPWPELQGEGSVGALLQAMNAENLPLAELFGEVRATVWQLEE